MEEHSLDNLSWASRQYWRSEALRTLEAMCLQPTEQPEEIVDTLTLRLYVASAKMDSEWRDRTRRIMADYKERFEAGCPDRPEDLRAALMME